MCSYSMDGGISFSTNRLKSVLGWNSEVFNSANAMDDYCSGRGCTWQTPTSDGKANPVDLAEMPLKPPVPKSPAQVPVSFC